MEDLNLDEQFGGFEDPNFKPWGMEMNTFCMLMHLSQLSNFIIPLAGLVLPIIMWATNKDQSSRIDKQGKEILNWMITLFIGSIIGFILVFLLIGSLVLLALGIAGLVFAILGAIKAHEGEVYEYPFSIKFIN